MMDALANFPGIETNVLLSGHSTFGVGGPADYFYRLREAKNLAPLLNAAHETGTRVFILGGGSNVLFADDGYRGLIIKVELHEVSVEGERVVAGAGARWPELIRAMEAAQLTGLEPMSGLPGTLGGAITGNAGCFGVETADLLESAILYDPQTNRLHTVERDYFEFGYRWSRLKEHSEVVLGATLQLRATLGERSAADVLKQRMEKQPPGRTSGSFFKNPSPEQPAGALIDRCGLKGLQIGGAQISPKHANFFINTGGATAADLLVLRDRAKAAVRDQFGIELKEEVVMVNASD